MSSRFLKETIMLWSIVAGFVPISQVIAQDDAEQIERLDGLFVPDEDDMETRRAEFEKNNPEAAARMQERREEMEAKRAEFGAKYPEAAAEMKGWREADKANREQQKAAMEARRKQFVEKYPDAAAELRNRRAQGVGPRGGNFGGPRMKRGQGGKMGQ